jgi:hypothetical protein
MGDACVDHLKHLVMNFLQLVENVAGGVHKLEHRMLLAVTIELFQLYLEISHVFFRRRRQEKYLAPIILKAEIFENVIDR